MLKYLGGAATHLLTLTPQTEGLYQRAVAMSGVGFNPWAFSPRNDHSVYMSSFGMEFKYLIKFTFHNIIINNFSL